MDKVEIVDKRRAKNDAFSRFFAESPWKGGFAGRRTVSAGEKTAKKYPQQEIPILTVDIVDNSFPKKEIAHFYNVSRPHGYQQVAVDTIF